MMTKIVSLYFSSQFFEGTKKIKKLIISHLISIRNKTEQKQNYQNT